VVRTFANPGGMTENSPPIYRWERALKNKQVPPGTKEFVGFCCAWRDSGELGHVYPPMNRHTNGKALPSYGAELFCGACKRLLVLIKRPERIRFQKHG
jgi:hypothetical protein